MTNEEIVKEAIDVIYNLLVDFPADCMEKYRFMKYFEEQMSNKLNSNKQCK